MIYERVFQAFLECVDDTSEHKIPQFSYSEICSVCESAKKYFSEDPTLLDLNDIQIVVVGDLHGHFFDLARVLNQNGLPPKTNYLFLGDFVDRGEFSVPTIELLFVLKCMFPENVYLIRGNHEFSDICQSGGFLSEIKKIYGNKNEVNPNNRSARAIFEQFIDVFSVLPIIAVVNKNVICVHGGIGPKFQKIQQTNKIARPINSLYGGIVDEILWSDPSCNVKTFRPSGRGIGFDFGREAIKNFLDNHNFRLMIRAHQPAQEGIHYDLEDLVLTVFTASNYCGEMNNNSGVVILKPNEKEETIKYDPLPYIKYEEAKIVFSDERKLEVNNNSDTTKKPSKTKAQTASSHQTLKQNGYRKSQPPMKKLNFPVNIGTSISGAITPTIPIGPKRNVGKKIQFG